MLYLLFQIGNDRYALEAVHASEVIPLVALRKIPHAPRGVAGIFNYHGQPVPALDLCELIAGRPARERLSTRIILLQCSDPSGRPRRLGLIAERATGMMRRDEREFADSGVSTGAAPYLGPVLMDGQGVIQLIRAAGLAGLAGEWAALENGKPPLTPARTEMPHQPARQPPQPADEPD